MNKPALALALLALYCHLGVAAAAPPILCAPPPPPQGCPDPGPIPGPGPGGGAGGGNHPGGPGCCNQQNLVASDPDLVQRIRSTAAQLPPGTMAKNGGYTCGSVCPGGPSGPTLRGESRAFLQIELPQGQQQLFSSYLTLVKPELLAAGSEMSVVELELQMTDGQTSRYHIGLLRQESSRLQMSELRAGETAAGRQSTAAARWHLLLSQDQQLLRVQELGVDLGRQQHLPLLLAIDRQAGQLQLEVGAAPLQVDVPGDFVAGVLRLGRVDPAAAVLAGARPGLWFFDLRLSSDGTELPL